MNTLLVEFARFQTLFPNLAGLGLGLIKSSAILVLAAGISSLLRKRSARARSWVWRLALACLFGLALWQILPEGARAEGLAVRAVPVVRSGGVDVPPVGDPGTATMTGPALEQRENPLGAWFAAADKFLMPLWLGVAALLVLTHLGRTGAGIFWLRRHSRSDGTASVEVEVRVTGLVDTPILAGFFRPAIYLPEASGDWPAAKRRCVLLHELAHRSRGDLWWQLLGTGVCCLWWGNPLAWMGLSRLKREAEEAADDAVVIQEGAAENYARVLVEMASDSSRQAPVGIPMLGRSSLEQRIRLILTGNPLRGTIGAVGMGLLGVFVAFSVLCLSVGIVLAEADLTNSRGEIVHYQAGPAKTQFPEGNFRKTGANLQAWTGSLAGASSPERGMVRLKAAQEAAVLETTLKVQPEWKWLTVMARTRPAPGTKFDEGQAAEISFTPGDASGRSTGAPVTITEARREGYTNWTSGRRTFAVAPGTTQLKIQMSLAPGTGGLDCSEIFVVPSDPADELDHRLVDRFFEAVQSGDPTTVESLLKAEPRLVDARRGSQDNGTPLTLCAWNELPAMAQVLIDHGANLEAVDNGAWRATPLAWCGWWGSPETAKVLLKAGANAKFKSDFGVTPLSSAKAGKGVNGSSRPGDFDQVIALFTEAEK